MLPTTSRGLYPLVYASAQLGVAFFAHAQLLLLTIKALFPILNDPYVGRHAFPGRQCRAILFSARLGGGLLSRASPDSSPLPSTRDLHSQITITAASLTLTAYPSTHF